MNVWVVAYFDDGDLAPTVTVFDNETVATFCYNDFIMVHKYVTLKEVPINKTFYWHM